MSYSSFNANSSAAAKAKLETPKLLAIFSSPTFRQSIASTCPQLSNLSSTKLLARVRDELRVVELIHTIPSVNGAEGTDQGDATLGQLINNSSFFYNLWQDMYVELSVTQPARNTSLR